MIIAKYVAPVKSLIYQTAKSQNTITFPGLFSQFPKGTPPSEVYTTLEAACEELASWTEAIYSVVLAKGGTGMPGDGFFDIFRIHRREEYASIAGDTPTLKLSDTQKNQMVTLERARVYAHASC